MFFLPGCASYYFDKAREKNTFESYSEFINAYDSHELVKEAEVLRERALFNQVKNSNNIDDYIRYSKKYPNGSFISKIKYLIDKRIPISIKENTNDTASALNIELERAIEKNTFQSYNKFLKNPDIIPYIKDSPYSFYVIKAEKRLFGLYLDINTVEMYSEFIRLYPSSNYVDDATFYLAKIKRDVSEYEDYMAKFPNGKHIREAKDFLETPLFELAKNNNTSEAYKNYIKVYPAGKYIREAYHLRDKALSEEKEYNLFKFARSENSVSKYNIYLKYYPKGKYSKEARLLKEKVIYEQSDTVEELITYIDLYPNGKYINKAKNELALLAESEFKKLIKIGLWSKEMMGRVRMTYILEGGDAIDALKKIRDAMKVKDPGGFFNPYWVPRFYGMGAKGNKGVIIGTWYTDNFSESEIWLKHMRPKLQRALNSMGTNMKYNIEYGW